MKKCILIKVPWKVHYRDQEIASFMDTHGKCMDVIYEGYGGEQEQEYQNDFLEAYGLQVIDGVLVIFIAEKPNKKNYVIVGWYRNATAYQDLCYDDDSERYYRVICDVEDAFLLSVDERNHEVTTKVQTFLIATDGESKKIYEYIEQSIKQKKFVDISLSISDERIIQRATPESQKKLISQFEKTFDPELLPEIYGYATEWAIREPQNATAWDYKGYALQCLGYPGEALRCYDKSLSLGSNDLTMHDKGICLLRLCRYQEAIEVFNSLLEKTPTNDAIRLQLAMAYSGTGFEGIAYRLMKEIQDVKIKKQLELAIKETEEDMPYLLSANRESSILDSYPVYLPLSKESLPEQYKDSSGAKRYIDPIRQKGIPMTPEEKVRQQVISYVMHRIKIPREQILVEESLSHIDRELRDRVDILVWCQEFGKRRNLLLIECKAPGIPLEGEPTKQMLRYNNILQAPFTMLTDGTTTHLFYFNKKNNNYQAISQLPTYDEMCKEANIKPITLPEIKWKRPEYKSLNDPEIIKRNRTEGNILGEDISRELAPIILNIGFCLLDDSERVKCPLSIPGGRIIKDYGVVPMSIGNAGGGSFYGNYRWFGVEDWNGKRENVYIAVFSTAKVIDDPHWGTLDGKSIMLLAVEEHGKAVSRLQISLDKCLKTDSKGFRLTHTGIRSRRKVQPLIDYVSTIAPELLGKQERVEFGLLDGSKNLNMSDQNTAEVIGKAIIYTLIRSDLKRKENE